MGETIQCLHPYHPEATEGLMQDNCQLRKLFLARRDMISEPDTGDKGNNGDQEAEILDEVRELEKALSQAYDRLKRASGQNKEFNDKGLSFRARKTGTAQDSCLETEKPITTTDRAEAGFNKNHFLYSSISTCLSKDPLGLPLHWSNPLLPSSYPASQLHRLLLLSDSALPLGSFAFSSGLESYIAHHKYYHQRSQPYNLRTNSREISISKEHLLLRFIPQTLTSISTTTLPYVISSWEGCSDKAPTHLIYLDDQLDASISCPVVRRSSIFQGKALLSIWEKSFLSSISKNTTSSSNLICSDQSDTCYKKVLDSINTYKFSVRKSTYNSSLSQGHFPVVWGAVSRSLGISLDQTCYIYLLNHLKTVLSAAVRQSLIGPYAAQMILASKESMENLSNAVEAGKKLGIGDAGQTIPTFDLYQGRHELLYSRVFNS